MDGDPFFVFYLGTYGSLSHERRLPPSFSPASPLRGVMYEPEEPQKTSRMGGTLRPSIFIHAVRGNVSLLQQKRGKGSCSLSGHSHVTQTSQSEGAGSLFLLPTLYI